MVGLCWFMICILVSFPLVVVAGLSLLKAYPGEGDKRPALGVAALSFVGFSLPMFAYTLGRHYLPKRPIGRHAKLAVQATTLSTALLMRLLLGHSFRGLVGFVSAVVLLISYWKLLYGVNDLTFFDVLMGAVMKVAVFETFNQTYVFVAVLLLSGGFIFSRYWFYSAPVDRLNHKVDLEMSHT